MSRGGIMKFLCDIDMEDSDLIASKIAFFQTCKTLKNIIRNNEKNIFSIDINKVNNEIKKAYQDFEETMILLSNKYKFPMYSIDDFRFDFINYKIGLAE